jgi:hypothetical protein
MTTIVRAKARLSADKRMDQMLRRLSANEDRIRTLDRRADDLEEKQRAGVCVMQACDNGHMVPWWFVDRIPCGGVFDTPSLGNHNKGIDIVLCQHCMFGYPFPEDGEKELEYRVRLDGWLEEQRGTREENDLLCEVIGELFNELRARDGVAATDWERRWAEEWGKSKETGVLRQIVCGLYDELNAKVGNLALRKWNATWLATWIEEQRKKGEQERAKSDKETPTCG